MRKRDENLMLVVAAEQYAQKYGMETASAFSLMCKYGVNTLIRQHYGALHTQPLDESFRFAEDIIHRNLNGN